MAWFDRGVVLNVNPGAGSYDADTTRDVLERFQQRCGAELVETTDTDELDAAVADLRGRALVVIGGDGSVHAAAAALHRADALDAVLAVVPQGTGNDLAGGAGIPEGLDAVDHLLAADVRPIDLLVTDETTVVNAAHAGLGAIAAERGSELKASLGKAAYPAGALAAAGSGPWRCRVEVDGTVVADSDEVILVAVANGTRVGGGTELAPGAVLDDGMAEVIVAVASGGLDRVALGAAIVRGNHLDLDTVAHLQGREVRVSGAPLPWNLDGELPGERSDRSFTVLPGVVNLVR